MENVDGIDDRWCIYCDEAYCGILDIKENQKESKVSWQHL